jgi:fimbrial chaperone protein
MTASRTRTGLIAFLVSLPTLAIAGSFQVSPVRVQLTPAAATAAITVRNESSTDDVVVQLRATNWKQENGEDVYTPSTELIATPPIFTMKPGASQTVRIGLRKTVLGEVQQTFRLYITEVPPPPKPGFQGLQVALNVGIPVFIAPQKIKNAPPTWKATIAASGALALSATNNGNAHLQVLDINVFDEQDSVAIAVSQQPRYILANQTVSWQIPITRPPKGKLRINARTDASAIDTQISLEPAAATP